MLRDGRGTANEQCDAMPTTSRLLYVGGNITIHPIPFCSITTVEIRYIHVDAAMLGSLDHCVNTVAILFMKS